MKRKVIVLLLVALALVALCFVAACSQDKAASDGGDDAVTLNIWHSWISEDDENRVATEDFIKAYTDEHPNVKVEQHILQDADYKNKLLTEFSGNAENVDVFTYWGAGRAGDLVNAGKLVAVEDYLTDEQVNSIKPGADTNFRYDGKLYGLPQASWMMLLYCNTELFEQNNIKLPETYDEWLDACTQFADKGIIPIALGGGVDDGWQAAFVYEALVNRTVGAAAEQKVLESMSGFFDDPGFEEAAVKVIEMNKVASFGKSPLEIDEETANVQFLTGAAAMRLTGSWYTQSIYTEDDSVVEGKVAALPIPMVPGGKGLATDYVGGFIDGIFVNQATKDAELASNFAYEWAHFLGTRQHETGEGFTAYTGDVDESGLFPLGKEISDLANTMVDGIVAWDTFLPGDLADIHIDACQALLGAKADVGSFMDSYTAIFK